MDPIDRKSVNQFLYKHSDAFAQDDNYSDTGGIHSGENKECDYSDNKQYCHYDPMPFDKDDFNGIALGQVDKAEGHLRNQDIGEGDIFLFYGWFKKVEKFKGAWRYAKQEPNIHLIWSYMEIGDCMELDTMEQHAVALKKYPFLTKHPHAGKPGNMKDRIYLSNMHSYFSYQQNLCLTDIKNYKGRSTWRLSSFMNKPQAFSHLNDFKTDDEEVIISYRGYGQ